MKTIGKLSGGPRADHEFPLNGFWHPGTPGSAGAAPVPEFAGAVLMVESDPGVVPVWSTSVSSSRFFQIQVIIYRRVTDAGLDVEVYEYADTLPAGAVDDWIGANL